MSRNALRQEIHVYRESARVSRVVLRDADSGEETELTGLMLITKISRTVEISDIPKCDLQLFARLIEHDPDASE